MSDNPFAAARMAHRPDPVQIDFACEPVAKGRAACGTECAPDIKVLLNQLSPRACAPIAGHVVNRDRGVQYGAAEPPGSAASRNEAAIETARQFRTVDKGGVSIESDSSSQSLSERWACCGPNTSATARVNADDSSSSLASCSR
jgi:hypothetical protein